MTENWTADRIRQAFLDFFAERGHAIVPSASLVPRTTQRCSSRTLA